jgi:hypothetical protein
MKNRIRVQDLNIKHFNSVNLSFVAVVENVQLENCPG